MKKRGKKSWRESDTRKEELYNAYLKQYNKAYEKYGGNMDILLSKNSFFITYDSYFSQNPQNVVRSIVKDQRLTSTAQARAWAKASKKLNMNLKVKDFMSATEKVSQFWSKVKEKGGWKKAIYVDD